ncbi:hypothetical protein AB0F59_32285 [Micromonospora lupini]|uniref:hypothetical protein n=1 Tax=Micromonospora lupini TaxID=285679 RepID=UPI0033D57FAE
MSVARPSATDANFRDDRPQWSARTAANGWPAQERRLSYGGVELTMPTGLVRLYPEMRAVKLSGQQAATLAVLIACAGKPCDRKRIAAAMPPGFRPPQLGQIGVVISNIRRKLGPHRVSTGAGGWWLEDLVGFGDLNESGTFSYGELRLDVARRRVWLSGQQPVMRLGWQEFLVLQTLMEARGTPRDRNFIWQAMPTRIRPQKASAIGVIVHRLRQRVGRDLIVTGGGGWRLAGPPTPDRVIAHASNEFVLDPAACSVHLADRPAPIRLSPQQAATLRILIEARGEPLRGAQVFERLPDALRPNNPVAVGTAISRLRKKLGPDRIGVSRQGWRLT